MFIKYENSLCDNTDELVPACENNIQSVGAKKIIDNITAMISNNDNRDLYPNLCLEQGNHSFCPEISCNSNNPKNLPVAFNEGNLNNVSENCRALNSNNITLLHLKSNTSYPSTASYPAAPCLPQSYSSAMDDGNSISPCSYRAIPSTSFSPPHTTSATGLSSPHLSTLTATPFLQSPGTPNLQSPATPSLQSPDIPASSLSNLFPSLCSVNPCVRLKDKEKEKTIPLKGGNPLLSQISNFSSFASSFASSPSSPHSIFSKDTLLEPQGDGAQSVFIVGNRERSVSQLSTPSSFTSSPPSLRTKSNPALPDGLSTSPNPNTRQSFFSYEVLNSALNMNKSRSILQKCNDKAGINNPKWSISNNNNNNNNSNNSSSSGSSSSGSSDVPAVVNDVNQESEPARRPIANYPVPCDSVSKVLIHGFLSQGTEYSFFLPPQPKNEFIGKRVSQTVALSLFFTSLTIFSFSIFINLYLTFVDAFTPPSCFFVDLSHIHNSA